MKFSAFLDKLTTPSPTTWKNKPEKGKKFSFRFFLWRGQPDNAMYVVRFYNILEQLIEHESACLTIFPPKLSSQKICRRSLFDIYYSLFLLTSLFLDNITDEKCKYLEILEFLCFHDFFSGPLRRAFLLNGFRHFCRF